MYLQRSCVTYLFGVGTRLEVRVVCKMVELEVGKLALVLTQDVDDLK